MLAKLNCLPSYLVQSCYLNSGSLKDRLSNYKCGEYFKEMHYMASILVKRIPVLAFCQLNWLSFTLHPLFPWRPNNQTDNSKSKQRSCSKVVQHMTMKTCTGNQTYHNHPYVWLWLVEHLPRLLCVYTFTVPILLKSSAEKSLI